MRIKFYNSQALQVGQDIINNGDQNLKLLINDNDLDEPPYNSI